MFSGLPETVQVGKSILKLIVVFSLATSLIFGLVVLINFGASLVYGSLNMNVIGDLIGLIQIGLPFNINTVFTILNTCILLYFSVKLAMIIWYVGNQSLRD